MSAAPGVQAKYAAEHASRAAGKAMKKKIEEHRSAISVRTRDLLPTHALNLLPHLDSLTRESCLSMHPLLICHAPTLTHACPHYLYGAPQLLPCVLPHCRPRRVAGRTYSVKFPGKDALIRKKSSADARRRRRLSPRGGPKKKRFSNGVFLRLN